jgi:hypothetical protein
MYGCYQELHTTYTRVPCYIPHFQDKELDIAPSNSALTLKWLKNAFGVCGGNAVRTPKWIPTNEAPGQSPQLETLYQPILDDEASKESIR